MLKFIFVKEVIAPTCIIAASIFLYITLSKIIKGLFKRRKPRIDERKTKTMLSLILNIIKYFFIIIAVLLILEVYNIDTKSIIASLGVAGLVVGLSLQDTLKDFISGLFIIFEDQFGLGDTITIDNFKGEVISLGIKTTKIKSYTGDIQIIPNRNINNVINHSLASSLALVNVQVSYNSDMDKVELILKELCKTLTEKIKNLNGEITLLGITDLADSGIEFRISAPTKSMCHYEVEREIRKEIKKAFDKNNIEIPFPQVVIHNAWL